MINLAIELGLRTIRTIVRKCTYRSAHQGLYLIVGVCVCVEQYSTAESPDYLNAKESEKKKAKAQERGSVWSSKKYKHEK